MQKMYLKAKINPKAKDHFEPNEDGLMSCVYFGKFIDGSEVKDGWDKLSDCTFYIYYRHDDSPKFQLRCENKGQPYDFQWLPINADLISKLSIGVEFPIDNIILVAEHPHPVRTWVNIEK